MSESKARAAFTYAIELESLARADVFDDARFDEVMDAFAEASGQAWPDVPAEVVIEALGNGGTDAILRAVLLYRVEEAYKRHQQQQS